MGLRRQLLGRQGLYDHENLEGVGPFSGTWTRGVGGEGESWAPWQMERNTGRARRNRASGVCRDTQDRTPSNRGLGPLSITGFRRKQNAQGV